MLGTPNATAASPELRVPDLGFKRIWAVRVWTGAGPARFEVEGVVHRRPVTRPVTGRLAARLVAAGVPVVVREAAGAGKGSPC